MAELVPEARIAVAHGQMPEQQLEQIVVDFWERKFDVLVSTTIIETGIDIPNANTLIVDRADTLGCLSCIRFEVAWVAPESAPTPTSSTTHPRHCLKQLTIG